MQGFNRNISRIEYIDKNKIISKEHKKLIFLKREEYFYNLFKKVPIIKTPKICSSKDLIFKTYFIEEKKKNLFLAISDWAKIHSYFIENPHSGNKIFMQHDLENVSYYLLNQRKVLKDLDALFFKKLEETKIENKMKTIVHGDLTKDNFITSNGINYYFDFELGGFGHPARDVASLVISDYKQKEKIISCYQDCFKYNYSDLDEDIHKWTFARAFQLYFIAENMMKRENKKDLIKKKLKNILEELV